MAPFWERRIDRRGALRIGTSALLGGALGALHASAIAQPLPAGERIRLGFVLPGTSGTLAIDESLFDLAADAARAGAVLADSDVAALAQGAGHDYKLLAAHAPTASAARRAGERLVALDGVDALVGGLGAGHAEVLHDVAATAGILFFNVGDPADRLRNDCAPGFTFHVEPSQAMFLDALVAWYAALGRRRWFLIDDPGHSGGVRGRFEAALARHGRGGELVAAVEVREGQPLYFDEMRAMRETDADVVLLSVFVRDEIYLRHLISEAGPVAVAALPGPVTQTRDFLAASRVPLPPGVRDQRVMTWETTLADDLAGPLNQRGTTRRGQPFDPAGWATYQAIRAYHQGVVEAGSRDPVAVRARLTDPDRDLVSPKGAGVRFRAWDHQLRQPLYVVEVDPDAPWGMLVSARLAVASLVGVLPDGLDASLDDLGDGPADGDC